MVDPRKVGAIIYEYRAKKNLTQEQLGGQLGVSAQAVSKWEKGDSLPDVAILPNLAKELGFTIDFLLGNESPLEYLMPQIEAQISKQKEEERIQFLGQILYAIRPPNSDKSNSYQIRKGYPYLRLTHHGITWWINKKAVFFATSDYLGEARDALLKEADFPLNVIPSNVLTILSALIPTNLVNSRDHAIPEEELRIGLPENFDFHGTMDTCIDLGFAERVRAGYRLNLKAEFAVRVFSVINLVLSGRVGTSVSYPVPEELIGKTKKDIEG